MRRSWDSEMFIDESKTEAMFEHSLCAQKWQSVRHESCGVGSREICPRFVSHKSSRCRETYESVL